MTGPTRRHRTLLTALSLAALLALTACGSAGTTDEPSPDGNSSGSGAATTTVRFQLFGGPEELAAYEAVAAAFHGERPDIAVEISAVASQDDLLARLTAGFAAGNPPDVFLINFRKYGQFAELGALEPVQPRLDTSQVLDESDFFAAPLAAFRFDGESLTCLPQNVSSLVTYVNVDRFEQAGLTLPVDGWDWDELVAAAAALTDAEAGVYGLGTSPSIIRLAPLVWSNGGEVVDDQLAPTELTLDTPEAREALDFFLDLSLTHGVTPPAVEEDSRSSRERFLDGNLAMFWSSRREVPTFRTIERFTWDVMPFPLAPDGQEVTMLHADAWCLSAGGNATDAAWSFVEFASSVEGQTILAESGRTVPSRRAVAESAAFLRTDVPPANAQVFLHNAEIVRATPSTATWNEVEGRANDILEAAFYGRLSREDAIAQLTALRLDGA